MITAKADRALPVIDLLKTPLAEPIVKTGADIIVRNMDFAGADDLDPLRAGTRCAGCAVHYRSPSIRGGAIEPCVAALLRAIYHRAAGAGDSSSGQS
mgnify:CR=1 FL=1